jgi:hypothetical protein
MAQTQRQKHLSEFISDSLHQKKRVDETIKSYEALEIKQRERVIDQKALINDLTGHSVDQLDNLKQRELKDSQIRTDVQTIISSNKEKRNAIVSELQHHLIELTEIEIASSGFIAHEITTDHSTKFDDVSKIISFKNTGVAEAAIATYLDKWKDSSQLRFVLE